MKKYFLLSLIIIQSFTLIRAQNITSEKDFKSAYRNFLPSNANPDDLRPSDIPSKQVLKQMGLSEEEIKEAMDFKYGKGKYDKSKNISKDTISNIDKLYLFFEDSLSFDSVEYPKARIFGQDVFRNNRLAFYQKALDAKAPENYKVGPGDEISISIWGFNDFSETLEVDSRGYISPSSYGRIYVKGLTFKDMRSILKKKFSTFFDMQNSEIDVSLSYSKVITINIVGEVYNPGSYIIPSINTAFNALIAANGPTQLGSVRNIYIKRNGKTVDSLDIYQFLFNPEKSNDIYLQDGDYLFVPPAESIVEITGAVNRPYTYEAKTGETVQDMIRYAGGYSTKAFRDIITLKRLDYNDIKVYDVHYDDMDSEIIKNGDELVINNISNKISNVITVTGDIGVSGEYEYKKGESLLQLLQRAKCISQKTFTDKVYVIRLNKDRTKTHISVNLESIIENPNHVDNIQMQEYDIINVLSIDDFDDDFYISVQGAVRSGGDFDYGDGMSLQAALFLAGGLTQQAEGSRVEVSRIMEYDINTNKLKPRRAVVKNVMIGNDLTLSNEAEEFELQPYDQIFVRSNPDFEPAINVKVMGEVRYPGIYSILRKNEKISSLIKRAGGLTDYAYLDGVKMYRKFKVLDRDNDLEGMNISDKLRESILNDPESASIYTEELEQNSTLMLRESNFDKEIGLDMVYLDLDKALKSGQSKHNLVLNEGDSIIIPKIMDVVHITGELMNLQGNSISAPYFNSKRANFYVKNFAGGFSRSNDKSNTVVVYPNGIAKKSKNFIFFKVSPKVSKGSTIRVTSKNQKSKRKNKGNIDWNRQIENAMLKISAVLTLWVLVDRVQTQ
ncbi:MAG: SLBB domain-containing protein [Flavobacteriales bacterium]|jgi:protein involved in polysaccharide export with SLBB domain|nr:SLBB domain-containing protein [Flavobacteriales bacterium]